MGETAHPPGPADEAARSRRFQALALPHLDAAYNLARWLSRNAGDAEDIVQEAFLRAFRFFDAFRGDEARPWLLAIVRRVWYDEWRRRAGAEEVAPFDELRDDTPLEGWETGGVDPETLAMRAEDSRLVQEALLRLPVEYREMLVLRELEELEYREIAAIVDVPVGTVMSRLARARRRLAALLAPQAGGRAPAQAAACSRAPVHDAAPCAAMRTPSGVGAPELGASNEAWRPAARESGQEGGRGSVQESGQESGRLREEPGVDGGAPVRPMPPTAALSAASSVGLSVGSSAASPLRRAHAAGGSMHNTDQGTEAPDEL
ncbi:RNA polymerase sigma factor [Paraburkholderia sp. J41]|uniref:RNA polymerase sigma factor n=1 Tax=Paraburkholderia sp. J41 TaxID=2805433 RepID=UPI002AC36B33|nr:RNA polymerase sigma factor [Paraburkholderia sp. J41]